MRSNTSDQAEAVAQLLEVARNPLSLVREIQAF